MSAYCTCFAGLGATCNHVAAVLFKLDYYWRQGLTNKSCTDTICSWNKYGSDKTVLQPVLAKNLQWRKPKFGKQKTEHLLKSIETSDPFSFEEVKEALLPVCSKAVVFQGQKDISPDDIFHVDVSTSAPPPLCDMLYICKSLTDIKTFLESFSDEDVKLIAQSTVVQSDNNLWASHRKCRITSSFVHDVYTRVNSLNSGKGGGGNITSVVTKVLHSDYFDYISQIKNINKVLHIRFYHQADSDTSSCSPTSSRRGANNMPSIAEM
ncbi:hypothetical protein SNE40_003814 [Patella caerulea]|uniref:SWIM-type domain-containing protein n=1 Tax=Patella caerulea TaxID=87958 RepID=A0AAN8KEX6_PATCE